MPFPDSFPALWRMLNKELSVRLQVERQVKLGKQALNVYPSKYLKRLFDEMVHDQAREV